MMRMRMRMAMVMIVPSQYAQGVSRTLLGCYGYLMRLTYSNEHACAFYSDNVCDAANHNV